MAKTADDKAKDVCKKLNLPEFGPEFSVIRLALLEQDRDTRHACAEAVLGAADPHAACMNAKAA